MNRPASWEEPPDLSIEEQIRDHLFDDDEALEAAWTRVYGWGETLLTLARINALGKQLHPSTCSALLVMEDLNKMFRAVVDRAVADMRQEAQESRYASYDDE